MNILRIKKRYIAGALSLMLSVALQAQDYGALKYMLQKRPANEKFEKGTFSDHLFLSAGVGPWGLMNDGGNGVGANASLFLGKWLTPIHGIRLGGNVGFLPSGEEGRKIKMIGASFDYLLNISSLAYRYDYDRPLELLGVFGIDGGYSKAESWKMYGGIHIGLQGKWHVSPLLDFFIEPRIGWYNNQIVQISSWRDYQTMGTLLAGFTYNMVPAEYRPTDRFENTSFRNHLFISLFGGLNTLKGFGAEGSLRDGMGPTLALGIGKWFTPASALRLSGVVGYCASPVTEKTHGDLKHIDLRADYMLNLNNVFGGYDPDRIFSLIGIAGVNMAASKDRDDSWNYAPGIGVGAQANFRVSRNLDLFVEPRINVYGDHYAGGRGWGQKDWTGEVNVGLTTYLDRADRSKRRTASGHFFDHMFMTAGAGAQLLLTKSTVEHSGTLGPLLSVSIGKWFNSISGLRLTGSAGYFASYTDNRMRHPYVTAGADYLLNIHSALVGYDPDRAFELIGTVGANVSYTGKAERKFNPGLNIGLQGLWHISPALGIYIEPQVHAYGDKLAPGSLKDFGIDALVALNAGIHYTFSPYQKANYREGFNENDRRMFASVALGTNGVFTADKNALKHLGISTQLSIGKWYTPLSAWRLNGTLVRSEAMLGTPKRYLYYAGAGVDYMMSLGTLANGYHPERIFDIVPYIGANMGISYRKQETAFVPGMDVGAQFKFRLSSALDFFIEPKIGIRSDKYDGRESGTFDKVVALLGGFSYKPQGWSRNNRRPVAEGFVPQTFVSLGMGTGLQKNSLSRKDLSVRTDVNIGRYFTALSGARLGLTNTNYKVARGGKERINIVSVHADYLLDVTTLLNGYVPDRRLTLSGIAGFNMNFSSATGAETVPGADLGLQAKWRISDHWDIYGEPMLNVYKGKADGKSYSGISGSCNMTLGTSYRF